MFHGHAEPGTVEGSFAEMTWREGLVLAPLVVLIVFLGVYPQPVLERIAPSVDAVVLHVEQAAHPTIPVAGQPVTTALVRGKAAYSPGTAYHSTITVRIDPATGKAVARTAHHHGRKGAGR